MCKRIFAVHWDINFRCTYRSFSFPNGMCLTPEVGQRKRFSADPAVCCITLQWHCSAWRRLGGGWSGWRWLVFLQAEETRVHISLQGVATGLIVLLLTRDWRYLPPFNIIHQMPTFVISSVAIDGCQSQMHPPGRQMTRGALTLLRLEVIDLKSPLCGVVNKRARCAALSECSIQHLRPH